MSETRVNVNPVHVNLLALVQGKQMPYGKGPQNELVLYPQIVSEHANAVERLLESLYVGMFESVLEEVWNPAKWEKP